MNGRICHIAAPQSLPEKAARKLPGKAAVGARSTPVADHAPAIAPTRERSSDKGTIAIGFALRVLAIVLKLQMPKFVYDKDLH